MASTWGLPAPSWRQGQRSGWLPPRVPRLEGAQRGHRHAGARPSQLSASPPGAGGALLERGCSLLRSTGTRNSQGVGKGTPKMDGLGIEGQGGHGWALGEALPCLAPGRHPAPGPRGAACPSQPPPLQDPVSSCGEGGGQPRGPPLRPTPRSLLREPVPPAVPSRCRTARAALLASHVLHQPPRHVPRHLRHQGSHASSARPQKGFASPRAGCRAPCCIPATAQRWAWAWASGQIPTSSAAFLPRRPWRGRGEAGLSRAHRAAAGISLLLVSCLLSHQLLAAAVSAGLSARSRGFSPWETASHSHCRSLLGPGKGQGVKGGSGGAEDGEKRAPKAHFLWS